MRDGQPRRLLATLLVFIAGCASSTSCEAAGETSVADYCAYGAVSEAQLQGCMDHVTAQDVDALDTNAARYVRAN